MWACAADEGAAAALRAAAAAVSAEHLAEARAASAPCPLSPHPSGHCLVLRSSDQWEAPAVHLQMFAVHQGGAGAAADA